MTSRNILHLSLPSLDGLEPPMLDETWGLSNHTLNYKGRYSKHPFANYTDDATTGLSKSMRQKFEQGNIIDITKPLKCIYLNYISLYIVFDQQNTEFLILANNCNAAMLECGVSTIGPTLWNAEEPKGIFK